jgi:RNA polymerase sigma factor (sigma-70 family)
MENTGGLYHIMKIPKNMSEEETLEKINLVVNRIAPKYSFSGYDVNDIKQEAFIICLDALNRYDQKRPLENFLAVNLSNRLKNFIRDNYCKSSDTDKKKVMCPSPMPTQDIAVDTDNTIEDKIFQSEMKELIEQKLPANLRMTYLKFINNVSITKPKREELINTLRDILNGEIDENR